MRLALPHCYWDIAYPTLDELDAMSVADFDLQVEPANLAFAQLERFSRAQIQRR